MDSKLSAGERACWYCVLLGTLMVGGPAFFPDSFKWNGGQYAMGLVGLLIALSAFVSVFIFRSRRKGRESITNPGIKLVAHWTYSPGEWAAFVGEDFEREKMLKWSLFRIVASFCLIIGGIFWFLDPHEGGPWVFGVLLVLVFVIMGVIVIGTRVSKKSRSTMVPEVRIADNGLLLGEELHLWKGWSACLESCGVVDGQPPCIEFVYSTPAKNQRQINSVRVPIPTGFDGEAASVVAYFVGRRSTSS